MIFWTHEQALRPLALAAGLVVSALALPLRAEVPPALFTRPNAPATFVRADQVLTPSGEVDASLFAEHDARTIRTYTTLPEEKGCVQLRGVMRSHPPNDDVTAATRNARLVLLATVVANAPGFSGAEAGTLLELEPAEYLKGRRREIETPLFAFFPVGSFSLHGKTYCATHPDYPALPSAGDRLLLFIRDPDSFPFSFLPIYDATDVIVLTKDSTVVLPRRFAVNSAFKPRSVTELLKAVRSTIGDERREDL